MRSYSNQQGGKPSGGHSSRPSENRGGGRGYGGGAHRENRGSGHRNEGRGNESRGNESRGNEGRSYDRHDRGGDRHGAHRSGPRPSHSGGHSDRPSGNWRERGDRPQQRFERQERPEGFSGPRGSSWVEVTGRSVEEAVEEACRRFNVNKADLKSETLEEGSKGFLGIGSKPTKVKISLKSSAVPPFAEGVLSRLLRGMSLPDKVQTRRDEDGNTVLNIQGPSSGTLIGRHGHTLESLQYLVSKVVQRMTGDDKSIVIVDVENYLERQKDKLKDLALNLAGKAKETGVEIPMRPMSSKDRRVVHLALKDHEHVTTESRGEGLRRKVVIVPKVKAVAAPAASPEGAASTAEPGNAAPVETKAEEDPMDSQPKVPVEVTSHSEEEGPEPGNMAPKEPDLDDNIGNKV